MTPEEINQRIEEWAGITSQYACHADGKIYETCVIDLNERHDCVYAPNIETKEQCNRWMQRSDTPTPDYYRSNAAMDLLGVLVGKKYWYKMSSHADDTHTVAIGEWTGITSEDGNLMWFRKYICEAERKPTIPAAICTAILELIEREGDNESR